MEYRFRSLELNSLKGVIGEYIARSFIRNVLSRKLLHKEKWDHVLFSRQFWSRRIFDLSAFREDFTFHGFYADSQLLSKYATAIGLLRKNHCRPDGLILKLQETGHSKMMKQSFLTQTEVKHSCKSNSKRRLPMVRGDLEVVEIKCGRNAKLVTKQKKTYSTMIAKGYPLRVISVRIVSFDSNRFLIEESRFSSPL